MILGYRVAARQIRRSVAPDAVTNRRRAMYAETTLKVGPESFKVEISGHEEFLEDNVIMKIDCTSDPTPRRKLAVRYNETDMAEILKRPEGFDLKSLASEVIRGDLWQQGAERVHPGQKAPVLNATLRSLV
jgi:hypothetical protein